MKCTFTISMLVAVAAATASDAPKLLNTNYNIVEGKSFTFKYSGCEVGCALAIRDWHNSKDVTVVTAEASGTSFDWTPSDIGSGIYNIRITRNSDKQNNYAGPFEYKGTGPTDALSTISSASATQTLSASSSSNTESFSRTSTARNTSGASTSTSASSTGSRSSATASTSVPNGGTHATPMAFMAGAVAVAAYLG